MYLLLSIYLEYFPTFTFLESERRNGVLDVVKSPASDERLRVVGGDDGHQVRDVPVEHVVHLGDQLLLERGELQEVRL